MTDRGLPAVRPPRVRTCWLPLRFAPALRTTPRFHSCPGLVLRLSSEFMNRGLSPHDNTPMPGTHKAVSRSRRSRGISKHSLLAAARLPQSFGFQGIYSVGMTKKTGSRTVSLREAIRMKKLLTLLFTGFFAATAVADEVGESPRETFVAYFRAMDAQQQDVAKALKTPECADRLHMNIHKLDIVDRLQPFYELSTPKKALVVARPFTTSAVRGRDEVIYAELHKLDGTWRIQLLNRTSPENASWLMKGFQVHPDVNLDLSSEAMVGEWWYPCASTVILKADGTGSDFEVGPGGPLEGQKPERFTWDVKGSVLNLRFADRGRQLIVTSIDHGHVYFKAPNKRYFGSWRRKTSAEHGGADQPATAAESKAEDGSKPQPVSKRRPQ